MKTMKRAKKVLTIDLGATSGKIGILTLSKGKIDFEVIHSFPTRGLFIRALKRDFLIWDVIRFLKEIVNVLESTKGYLSIGVDSWGVDFALLDSWGRLLALPMHYRDQRTEGVLQRVFEIIPREVLFERTGVYPMPINTLCQLFSMVLDNDPLLSAAKNFLMIADLFNYWLGGEVVCEYTLATTSQCYSVTNGQWDTSLLEALSIPVHIFPEVVLPGTDMGKSRYGGRIIAVACHDTASAVAATPITSDGVFLSTGTWCLIGAELAQPVITSEALACGFTNEGGYKSVLFLKNTTGMWLIEECNREWKLRYDEIAGRAAKAAQSKSFINPEDPRFFRPGMMTLKIVTYLRETDQPVPRNIGAFARMIFESLAFNCRYVIEKLETIIGKKFETIHTVGGAAKNKFFNQLVASVTRKTVLAGPYEATSIGNGLIQLITLKIISDLAEARKLVSSSFPAEYFEPDSQQEYWEERYYEWLKTIRGANEKFQN